MDELRAYRVLANFWSHDRRVDRGTRLVTDDDLTHEFWEEFGKGFNDATRAWRESQIAWHRKIREAQQAAAPLITPLLAGLPKLGCIIHEKDAIYLVTSGKLSVEKVRHPLGEEDMQGTWLFRRIAQYGPSSEEAVHVYAWAEEMPLSQAFEALSDPHPVNCTPDPWGSRATHNLLPRPNEDMDTWARRVVIPVKEVERIIARLQKYDDLEMALATPSAAAKPSPEMIAGMFPPGSTSMIAAASGTGKSTLAHLLAHIASAPDLGGMARTFLGQPVGPPLWAAFITVEEPEDAFVYRRERFDRLWPGADVSYWNITRDELPEVLELIRRDTVARGSSGPGIVILDSVRGCIEGDDTKTHVATEFHRPLTDFVRATGCALVLLHHTTKQPPVSLAHFRASISGSEAHIGFPRIVYGMINRGGGLIEFGPVKSNIPPEFLALKVGESILFRQDEQSWMIEPLTSDDGGAQVSSGEHVERICSAIAGLNKCKRIVKLSGRDGIWELGLPSLEGLGRTFMQRVVKSLIETRRVINDLEAGLLINDPEVSPAVADALGRNAQPPAPDRRQEAPAQ